MRKSVLLNRGWIFYKNPDGGYGEPVTLPHTWNAEDGQDGGNDYYRGTCKYELQFAAPEKEPGDQVYLEFDGVAMTADVFFNGAKAGHHEGGYSIFRINITEQLRSENTLEIYVDNSVNCKIYPQKADFTFYGGIYRPVKLITVPQNHFSMSYAGGNGIKVTPDVTIYDAHEKRADAKVTVELWVEGKADRVQVSVAGETKRIAMIDGYARTEFEIKQVCLWDGIENPYLYTAEAVLDSGDRIETTFGCRKIRMDAQEGFFLNESPYPLRGVSRHQDRLGVGNALSEEMHQEDIRIVKELGANTLRLAHYQHAQEFYDLCDREGLIVWAEIPYITMHVPEGIPNTLSQMRELIVQNYNHPSIVCWGLSNEITAAGKVTEELLDNHRKLNKLCHRLDRTRPTAMANVFMLETDSPLLDIPDINSYNLYYGWYLGELGDNNKFFDNYHEIYPDRCIGLSEYGADANTDYHSNHPERGDYTEEYQCIYHEHMMRMITERPWIWATHVWNLFDFAADGREEGGKHGINQKGLVTMDRKVKKDAFYLYKAYWCSEPFVHLCGRRYVDRAEDITEIKVYSNQNKVTLFVDGTEIESMKGSHVFCFEVPITGEHRIKAVSEACEDEMMVRRVSVPNPAYVFGKTAEVANWFDAGTLDAEYYSITDALEDLEKSPEAFALIQALMAQAAAKRGEVAEGVSENPVLRQMMKKMTLEGLLKQAKDAVSEEQVRELNRGLQKIRKRKVKINNSET